MELVYKKTYISKKEAMLRKNRRNIASFFLPFWEKLHQYSVFLQENRMSAYSARTAHPFQRNGAPFRFKLSKAQQVD